MVLVSQNTQFLSLANGNPHEYSFSIVLASTNSAAAW